MQLIKILLGLIALCLFVVLYSKLDDIHQLLKRGIKCK